MDLVYVEAGDLSIIMEDLGEGFGGDYDEDDPDDIEFVRFYVRRRVNTKWKDIQGCSYCTHLPITTPKLELEGWARIILSRIINIPKGASVKKLCATLSWIPILHTDYREK